MLRPFALAFVALVGTNGSALSADMTPLQAAAFAQYEACSNARNAGLADYGAQTCIGAEQAIKDLQAANPNAIYYEDHFLWATLATVQIFIGGAYGQIDGVLSARVCEMSELSWWTTGNIPADSPFAGFIRDTEASVLSNLTRCRNEQSTPPWARALP